MKRWLHSHGVHLLCRRVRFTTFRATLSGVDGNGDASEQRIAAYAWKDGFE